MKDIKVNFQWVSAKKYAETTGMPYGQVLSLCKNGKLDCVETEGGGVYKQFLIKLSVNSDMIPKNDYLELLQDYAALKTKLNNVLNILKAQA
ncbi:hypothetical protein Clocel_2454 [Clostridium cellulovorans 743B]|uniref:Uncharacterized protein n=2 Tax=Clostridium cellulovorans TaxID=1493 RepID=D9SQ31_CLOC7|nr:hypothetical protein Clocel_2454 [Clostridium cellulovorans 743B]